MSDDYEKKVQTEPAPDAEAKGGQKVGGNKRLSPTKPKGGKKKTRSNGWKPQITALVSCFAIRSYFPVYLGTEGFPDFIRQVHSILIAHDRYIELPEKTLVYISVLALYNRINWVASRTGTGFIEQASRLKAFVGGLSLPRVITKYINSVGVVTLPNSVRTVPLAFSPREQIDVFGMFSIQELAAYMEFDYDQVGNPWCIVPQLQDEYQRLVARIPRHGNLEPVKVDLEGEESSLVAYKRLDGNDLRPMTSIAMPREMAQYGAACRFRDFSAYASWPGEWKHLLLPCFSTDYFDYRSFLAELTLKDLSD